MAATILGASGTTFGTPTVATILAESVSWSESVNIAEVMDEDGDYVAAALSGKKITCSVSGTSTGATPTAIGTLLAITGAPTGSFYITGSSIERAADGFQKFSYEATAWGGITAGG